MTEQVLDENKLIAERRAKLAELRAGGNPFPNDFRPEQKAQALQQAYGTSSKEELETLGKKVSVAGRIVRNRGAFMVLQDGSGQIQLYVTKEAREFAKVLDLGDIVGVAGVLHKSGKGDLYVNMEEYQLLTKALRPLPDKFHGLADQEIRYRQRYVDLIANPEVRATFVVRSRVVQFIRQYLNGRDFLEVETPMLQTIPGGATARPFITHHNALSMDMYLRIAPELYLKRLVVGGFERVYEINRNFRNEGVSTRHNPEFTMLEFYQAYATYETLMHTTQALLRHVDRVRPQVVKHVLEVAPRGVARGQQVELPLVEGRVVDLQDMLGVTDVDDPPAGGRQRESSGHGALVAGRVEDNGRQRVPQGLRRLHHFCDPEVPQEGEAVVADVERRHARGHQSRGSDGPEPDGPGAQDQDGVVIRDPGSSHGVLPDRQHLDQSK